MRQRLFSAFSAFLFHSLSKLTLDNIIAIKAYCCCQFRDQAHSSPFFGGISDRFFIALPSLFKQLICIPKNQALSREL